MNKIEEFWYCVAPQEDIPLPDETQNEQQESFDKLVNLLSCYKKYYAEHPTLSSQDIVQQLIIINPYSITSFRKLIDISDKRLYLDLTYLINHYQSNDLRLDENTRENLVKHTTQYFINYLKKKNDNAKLLAKEISIYFCDKGLASSLEAFSSLSNEQLFSIFTNLIINRETLHRDAKLRGHGVEQAFAKIFQACNVSIIPFNKATDPMGEHDPNVDLSTMEIIERNAKNDNCHSFDLVVTSNDNKIRVLIQSLIHTSDPGQYGVNKSDETLAIKKRIRLYNNQLNPDHRVYLLGSVDGVGFSENPNGTIVKMLDAFDDFFQMHTLFKIPVFLQKIGIITNIKGIAFDTTYFQDYAIDHFVNAYLNQANITNMTNLDLSGYKTFEAGKAIVIFK